MQTKLHSTQLEAIHALTLSIYAPMFAERGDLREAFAYAHEVAKASDNPTAVYTAVHVVANTIAKQIEAITHEPLLTYLFEYYEHGEDGTAEYQEVLARTKEEALAKFRAECPDAYVIQIFVQA